jgi:hypothetical protein
VMGSFVPTQDDCVAMIDTQPSANGAVYSDALHVCKVMTNYNKIAITLHQNAGWTTFVKDIGDMQVVLAKFQNGIANGTNPPSGNVYNIWTNADKTYTTTYEASVASLDVQSACGCHYRNPYIDKWQNVLQVGHTYALAHERMEIRGFYAFTSCTQFYNCPDPGDAGSDQVHA